MEQKVEGKVMGNQGSDPTLPFGEPKKIAIGQLMDFPGKKGGFPNGKAAESFKTSANQNKENEGFGGR